MVIALIGGLIFYFMRRPRPQAPSAAFVVDGGTPAPSMSHLGHMYPPPSDDGATAYTPGTPTPVTPMKLYVRFFFFFFFPSRFSFFVHSQLVVGPERSYNIPRIPQRADVLARLGRACPRYAIRGEYVHHPADCGPRREHAGRHADHARGVPWPAYRLILDLHPHAARSE